MLSPDRPLVVIGAPGAGTSSVARALAARLGRDVVDVTERVEAIGGLSVGELFATVGEAQVADWERDVTLAALAQPGVVVAAASGSILTPSVRAALAEVPVLWLQVDATHSSRRSGLSAIAPAIFGGMRTRLIRQLAERDPLYDAVADIRIDTNHADLAAVVAAAEQALDTSA